MSIDSEEYVLNLVKDYDRVDWDYVCDELGHLFASDVVDSAIAQLALQGLIDIDDKNFLTLTKLGKAPLGAVPKATVSTQDLITEVCNEIRDFLLDKNRKYGDSAISPIRIFSKASAIEQIRVRLDDKLSRVLNVQPDDEEDVISDLIGYLILYKVCERAQGL